MTNLISPVEAFNSMLLRKKVLARFKNSGSDLDFVDIKTLPADVFIDSDYEFCIQKEMVELSGFNFTKPLNFTDVQNGQEIFIIMPTCILHTKYDSEHSDICKSIEHGFVQADIENAKLQVTAIAKTFGFYVEEIEVKEGFDEKPKRQRKQRETKITTIDEEVEQTIAESQDIGQISEHASDDQCELTIDAIGTCKTVEETENFVSCISETDFSPDQWEKICKAKADKLSELLYQSALDDYLNHIERAKTPTEVNSVFGKVTHWTDEQRKPLHAAASRRLAELPQPEVKDPPSLLVRIQRAANLDELAELEIEVSTRDAQIVPALMSEVKKRRAQINQFNPSFVGDLP